MSKTPWYGVGLRFECTRCGHCCGGGSGTVRVTHAELSALAARLELAEHEFRAMYTRGLPDGATSLREHSDGCCTFYRSEEGCHVYSDRPRQCRSWPFWRAVVATPERWAEEARSCPGMNRGPVHSAAHIIAALRKDGTSGPSRKQLRLRNKEKAKSPAACERYERRGRIGPFSGHAAARLGCAWPACAGIGIYFNAERGRFRCCLR